VLAQARELTADLTGEQDALLIEQLIAFLRQLLLVLELQQRDARRGELATRLRHAALPADSARPGAA
jgi:hypothetical protein